MGNIILTEAAVCFNLLHFFKMSSCKTCKVTDEGRNDIRFNNSKGKTLLENWVEERAVEDLDPTSLGEATSSAQLYKDGHHGLLTINTDESVDGRTTYKTSYKPPTGPNVGTRGRRDQMLEQALYEKVGNEVHEEFNRPPEPPDYRSVKTRDFDIPGFEPSKPAPTASHDYRCDQPVSYWTEHRDVAHGISNTRPQFNTVFRKNTSFSKPIDEYWEPNEPQPYQHDHAPNM